MQIIHLNRPPLHLPPPLETVLPLRLRHAITQCNAPTIEELRLHSGRVTTVTSCQHNYSVDIVLREDDLAEILKKMCADSLYAYSESICKGYITMEGGIRVGVCGTAAIENGRVIGVHHVTGLTVRIPHSVTVNTDIPMFHILSNGAPQSTLIYAPPGVGKTTLLRAIAERAASAEYSIRTVIVDTREELAFGLDKEELTLDILKAYPRGLGIEIAVRCMGAEMIVCDEIGNEEDADAILAAANCGTAIVASAHAKKLSELLQRPAFERLHRAEVFQSYLGLTREKNRFQYEIHNRFAPIGADSEAIAKKT